jgi:glutathione synthase/RimK-type ligase-like ATP-grasp enzyme
VKKLIIVNRLSEWGLPTDGISVAEARDYLTDKKYAEMSNVRVFNLCKNTQYQGIGYYVSLLAEARGHKIIPNLRTLQDFRYKKLMGVLSEDLEELIQKSLKPIRSTAFILSVYFGENVAKHYEKLSRQLYNTFQLPLFKAEFQFKDKWLLNTIRPLGLSEIPEDHADFFKDVAGEYLQKKRYDTARSSKSVFDLAILVNPKEESPPSNRTAIQKFTEAAQKLGFYVELIGKDDFNKLLEFDALFIRETTAVNHHTYRFARKAEAEGLVVLDDPSSILRCTNKVFLAELLQKNKIPTPKSIIIHKENKEKAAEYLNFPCVLKKPDSSFSQGVVKVSSMEEYEQKLSGLLKESELIIGQEFLPTDYDWRIGILNQEIFYACKYLMAKDHWQIYNWADSSDENYGNVECVPLDKVPQEILQTSLKAANLIGSGLYGVDAKFKDGKPYIIEINDNPSMDCGYEDRLIKDDLYHKVMSYFKNKLMQQKLESEKHA